MPENLSQSGPVYRSIRRFFKAPEWGLVAGILLVLAVIYYLDKDRAFFGSYNIRPLLHRVALFGVLAIGAAVVIIAGGIDLSTGAVVALSSVVSAKLLTEWLHTGGTNVAPPPVPIVALAIVLTLLLGLTIGLFHALLINGLQIPPFIATLATMAGLRSIATILCHNRTINVSFDAYRVLGKESWVTLSIFSCVAVFMSILMGWTVLGRHLFALGGNETAARLSGLRTNRLKAVAYGLSGTLSALGGILFTGYSGQADSRLGVSYELTAITAAVVGGCSLSGGVGSIRGTVLGLLLTQIVLKGTGMALNQRFRGPRV
jgi:ribose/xylose/arabinose/galactoside ABC-type transport system permease subunit